VPNTREVQDNYESGDYQKISSNRSNTANKNTQLLEISSFQDTSLLRSAKLIISGCHCNCSLWWYAMFSTNVYVM